MTLTHTPLAGVRVLDASRVLAGPFCGQILGDLGAEVVKLERPGVGDETRGWGPPFFNDLSSYYLSCNRNKKAITLDLGQSAGLEIFHRLVEQSDILLENFRSASATKLGLGPAQLHARNPRLIIASISGFGRTGPMNDTPGYDFAIQALSGLMGITGPVDGPPSKTGVAVTDIFTGLYAAIGALACLHARKSSGHGYAIDLALLDCAVATQVNVVQAYLSSGVIPARQGNAHLQIVPYQAFATADDWLIVAIGNDAQWRRFCTAAQHPEAGADPRYASNADRVRHRAELIPQIEAWLRSQPCMVWQQRLIDAEVPHAPVQNYAQLFAQEQAAARGLKMTVHDIDGRPVDLVGTPFHIAGAELPAATMPPRLGEHTDAVLRDLLGMDPAHLAELRGRGVI